MSPDVIPLRVERDPDGEDNVDAVVGYGAKLPSGAVVVEWDRKAFPLGDQTSFPTESRYRTVQDARVATGGRIIMEEATPTP